MEIVCAQTQTLARLCGFVCMVEKRILKGLELMGPSKAGDQMFPGAKRHAAMNTVVLQILLLTTTVHKIQQLSAELFRRIQTATI